MDQSAFPNPFENHFKVYVDNDIQSETVSFLSSEKIIKQTDGEKLFLHANRSGFLNTELVSNWFVKTADPAYSNLKGELIFKRGDVDKTIELDIIQTPAECETSIFTVILSLPKLGKHPVCAVSIINDIERPTASLPVEKLTIRQSEKLFSIGVVRGGLGECLVAWKIINVARDNSPYANLSG